VRSQSQPRSSGFGHQLRVLLGIAVLAALWLSVATATEARVRPYYVVTGVGVASIKPRVLFVVDTSGSMAWKSQSTEVECVWNECEGTGGASQSRISTARRAIRQVVDSMAASASFSLMTFDQSRAPTTVVPQKCANGARFQWVKQYRYFSTWLNIAQYTGYTGTWRLCDDISRPYPYLRWDELGVGPLVTANNQTGTLPASPLISIVSASRQAAANGTRRVQWFPKFMGVRAQLNATTDPDGSILAGTIGDWASTAATRDSAVKGHDFYYWPYVDGFPGYANFIASPVDGTRGNLALGITEETPTYRAMLYAPFYLDLSATAIPAASRGPASVDAARLSVLDTVAPMISGGIDADGGTPWSSVIGVSTVVPPSSNAPYSHTTVASYLKFVITNGNADACAPTTAVLVTDGLPSPSTEAGAPLYARLAALRKTLGVRTYVVGFFLDNPALHSMACAAAGACTGTCSSPCTNTPTAAWDTCANPAAPATGCAYLAGSADTLATVLTRIISEAVRLDVESGPGTRLDEFGIGAKGTPGEGSIVQTTVRARTEWPAWRGHVERKLCTDVDPANPSKTAPWCIDQPFELEQLEETFGPCPQSRVWDAGECLRQTTWNKRRLFTHTASHQLVPLSDSAGKATAQFKAELVALGLMNASDANTKGDALVAFVLGKDFPASWKLPGLANSSPVVVRRIPKVESGYTPSVPIRDPHCAGRQLSEVDASGLPNSLETFSRDAWGDDGLETVPSSHRRYQEAVLIGDDLGVLHAFQLDSGNELFGFLPRFMLANAIAQWQIGATAVGQPADLAQHKYGIAATLNQGWVFDANAKKWRHLGVFGLGAGGTEMIALDLSHMSPSADDGPLEVLWTSEDAALKSDYDGFDGETWARPALGYIVPSNVLGVEPSARLVFGSGYPRTGAGTNAGRTLMYADATTGALLEHAVLPAAPSSFEPTFGSVVDPAIGSNCISRYWGELEQAYIADPAGRLFRWDLSGSHASDSGGSWGTAAIPALSLQACEGAGSTCTVGAGGHGDPFLFPPAVTANGRIDLPGGAPSGEPPLGMGQFLIALASGAPAEETISSKVSNFHSSLYLLVDDHSKDGHGGFDVPAGAPKLAPSSLQSQPHFARIAVSDLARTRKFQPFPGAPTYTEAGTFGRGTRPIRSPRIEVTGVVDRASTSGGGVAQVISGVEVYTITYTLYEPPSGKCDVRFLDSAKNIWYADEGSTYEVKLRVTAVAGSGFDFSKGAGTDVAKFQSGFSPGLVLQSVTQTTTGGCTDGNCGPNLDPPSMKPCDNNTEGPSGGGQQGFAITQTGFELAGFNPVE
jgi:hypothetical protein